jgi:hypothetical protein
MGACMRNFAMARKWKFPAGKPDLLAEMEKFLFGAGSEKPHDCVPK